MRHAPAALLVLALCASAAAAAPPPTKLVRVGLSPALGPAALQEAGFDVLAVRGGVADLLVGPDEEARLRATGAAAAAEAQSARTRSAAGTCFTA